MSGAITLSGMATLRSGAGLVTLAVPRTIQDIVSSHNPSYMTIALSDDGERIDRRAAKEVIALAEAATVVALGPGLGRSAALTEFVATLYTFDRPPDGRRCRRAHGTRSPPRSTRSARRPTQS